MKVLPRLLLFVLPVISTSASAISLGEVYPGESIEVPAFRYSADKSFNQSIHLRRIDVYAADAKVLVAENGGMREIPRSDLRLFVSDPDKEPQRMYLAISADGRQFEGAIFDVDGTRAIAGSVDQDRLQVLNSEIVEDKSFACGGSPSPLAGTQALQDQLQSLAADRDATRAPEGATHQALMAIDTDNEFMSLKFANNTTNANNYVAALMAGISVFYERDLSVRLQLGTVILRPSTTTDPYPSAIGSDIGDQLDEFGEHWRTNPNLAPGTVPRAFSAMLSGKSSSNNSASGIAWLITSGNYCSATGTLQGNGSTFGHYGVSRVFKFNGATAATDVSLVGHEIGHNFGAAHTHCSSSTTGGAGTNANQLIDRCFNAETGSGVCHSGTPVCPTDNSISGRGSVMSYCNFGAPSGANCGAVLQEFHPAHQLFLGGRINTNISNGCLTPLGVNVGPQIAAASPLSGSTTNVGGGTVGTQVNRNITFSASGGSGSGTTQLSCSVGSGTISIVSGTPQTIGVGGSVNPVQVRFTLTPVAQSGVINCTATRQGGSNSSFTYTFNANAGTVPSGTKIFCSGFESGQTGVCPN